MVKEKVFLICPVRDADPELTEKIKAYVESLEAQGYEVHWPKRDTEQVDPTGGVVVCDENYEAICAAGIIHVWYDETSGGSKFDIGIVYTRRKEGHKQKVVFANYDEAKKAFDESGLEKSHFKIVEELARGQ